ncbi:DNZ54_00345 family protein [Salmonella enterica]|uniref:Uncharacterized protein n=1 Tax=Salmonella typhimurium TaxID=90371 RepID=A0A7G2DK55_SALTM|nr:MULTISPECIES: DNZ54_00345 family protein [Salmonella]YP_001718739.1 hypothetical protein STM2714.2.Fels2 [Felsduovirus Fels2]MCY5235988.1 DNZ54_00345 family protein [Salmonella enterica subsp. enterica serovar 1,4,[5],12:i:-]MEA5695589.1 DNZ54_00345 family protein [Salmonella enterica subsp. enterica serovar Muenster]MEA6874164.1 DNZ54_00345 family protein [Salmonella enterica subsp. enterica serovar Anatum]VUC77813.1 bacteriophage protein [Salmonella sp. NCTC 11881]ELX60251.1 hypothetical
MKWLKSYWLPFSVLALLVMVDVNFPASHALFPLALVMWFEYAAFSLVCCAGLYSCTLTGGGSATRPSVAQQGAGANG